MEYARLAGERVSRLGMGNMRLPKRLGKVGGINYGKAEEIIDYALDHGINYFDTAWVYLGSEDFLGKALVSRHDRSTYFIADKYYALGNPNYQKVFEAQLRRLQTDHIDFYLIHSLTDGSYRTYVEKGSIEFFLRMKEEGKIGHLGFSTHASPATTERFADHHAWDFAQIQMNYYDWAFGHTKEEYEILTSRNIPIVVMEPVRGGKLAKFAGDAQALQDLHPDWSAASWALRWVRRHDNCKVILSGMSALSQIKDNVATFCEPALTAREADLLMQSCGAIKESMALPCTACRYCTEDCPQGIEIPVAIEAYNARAIGDEAAANRLLASLEVGPDACIGCGACAAHCPQGIDIPAAMAALAS